MQEHKTIKMTTKEVDIDIGITSVIRWLNDFESCNTLFSCEGGQIFKDGTLSQPYVAFTCWDKDDLEKILKKIRGKAFVEIEWHEQRHWFEYIARWYTMESFEEFKKCLNG